MEIQLIRSATFRLHYAGRHILTDPYLAVKGTGLSYAGGGPSPLVELPFSVEKVLSGVELVSVSHLHTDHFDPAAQKLIPKETAIFCQPGEDSRLPQMGFGSVKPVVDKASISYTAKFFYRTPSWPITARITAMWP